MELNVKLIVSNGTHTVEREVRVSDCAMAVTQNSETELYYQLGKAMREAKRTLEHLEKHGE